MNAVASNYGLWSLVAINSAVFILLSSAFILGGFWLLAAAWKVLYAAQRSGQLAATGPYARLRHPQYVGFIAIMAGFLPAALVERRRRGSVHRAGRGAIMSQCPSRHITGHQGSRVPLAKVRQLEGALPCRCH